MDDNNEEELLLVVIYSVDPKTGEITKEKYVSLEEALRVAIARAKRRKKDERS